MASRAWKLIESTPVDANFLGIRLSSVLAAGAIGLIPEEEAVNRVTAMLKATVVPAGERALGQYAASLVTLRQAIPSLAPEATRRLAAIDWKKVPNESNLLGSINRLAVFFQVATGTRPASAWTDLRRVSEAEGRVYVLEPAQLRDQLVPGLWLDERFIVTGASASQLAYAIAIEKRKTSTVTFPFDVQSTALLLEHFPAEVAAGLKRANLPADWMEQANPVDRSLLLLSLANLLAPDCLREWFQEDPLARAGRTAIAEFGGAAFGGENSLFARMELAVPMLQPPGRLASVVSSAMPRDKWQWILVKGLEYKVSDADVRPGDPDLELRFALTWDKEALHFHAEVLDTPTGFSNPAGRRSLELFINPKRNGLVWLTPDNFQFAYKPDGTAMEWFHNRPAAARIRTTEHGYAVDADIKWIELGIVPRPGLLFDLTASVTAGGIYEWDPALELSWRYYRRPDDGFGLGTVRLE